MTSREFSKIAGVSQSTVSRALNGAEGVSEEKRKMIIDLAKEYGFELNSSAKALKMNKTNKIGVYFGDTFISFAKSLNVTEIYENLRQAFEQYGYDMYPIYGSKEYKVHTTRNAVLRKEIDGIVFLTTSKLPPEEMLELVGERNIPHVGIYAEEHELPGKCCNISMEYWNAAYMIGKYLIDKGHRKIAFCSAKYDYDSRNKYSTFLGLMRENNIATKGNSHFLTGYTFQSGYDFAKANLDKLTEYTAIYAHNDASALGIIAALQDSGIKVPDDISIVGIGDISMCHWWHPHLTTVGFDTGAIVDQVVKAMISILNGEDLCENQSFKPYLVERESVKSLL